MVKRSQILDMYKIQLARSGEALLTIRICEPAVRQPTIKNMRTISDLILPHVSRWKHLEIDSNVPHKVFRVLFDRLRDARAPRLETLSILQDSSRWNEEQNIKWRFKAFGGGTPSLKRLNLGRAKVDWKSNIFNTFDHLAIRDGSLRSTDPISIASHFRDVLARAPHLRSLWVKVAFAVQPANPARDPLPLTPDPFTHSSIETFDISIHRGTVIDYLLHSIRMPALRTLETYYAILPSTLHPIARFKSLPQLRQLHIHHEDAQPPLQDHDRKAFPIALQSMRSLKKLIFRYVDLTGSDSCLPELLIWCPDLVALRFIYCEGVEKRALKEMVERRKQIKCPRLEALHILGENGTAEDFGKLVEEGEIIEWIRGRVGNLRVG
ncbi:hypothetical protein FS837_008129 [Tulasnella sp. UAMH 9824]|nr:hypothetical protein FS837_008129 [Tulasnella sp. UAMH 9824]